jgi:hypothetical protein
VAKTGISIMAAAWRILLLLLTTAAKWEIIGRNFSCNTLVQSAEHRGLFECVFDVNLHITEEEGAGCRVNTP